MEGDSLKGLVLYRSVQKYKESAGRSLHYHQSLCVLEEFSMYPSDHPP